jgi:hypothetical protein
LGGQAIHLSPGEDRGKALEEQDSCGVIFNPAGGVEGGRAARAGPASRAAGTAKEEE